MFKKALIKVSILLISFFIIGVSASILVLYYVNKTIPDHSTLKNYSPPVLSRIFASDGKLIGEHAQEKRIFVPYEYIPKKIIHAFLAAEDQNFFYHNGVDILSIIRAAVMNVLNKNGRPVGASTITQQVARNFFLSNKVSLLRKLKEAIIALRIEHVLSKEQIIEIYLNQIFLGNRSYGIASAASRYFDKSLEDLTIPEVAFLAGLPKAPSAFNPSRNPKRALQRRNWVIKRLWKTDLISESEFKTYVKTPITLRKRSEEETVKADYFQEAVRRELISVFGEDTFYGGGLFVKTSLDTQLQKICNTSLKQGLLKLDKQHGWRGPIKHITTLNETNSHNIVYWINYLQQLNIPHIPHGWQLAIVTNLSDTQTTIISESGLGSIHINTMKWAGTPLEDGIPGPAISHPKEALKVGDIIFVSKLQKANYQLQQLPKISGGMVVMDPHTGRVLALNGGFNFKHSQFNRATQALRQSGSAIKPFVYLTAFERGIKPSDIYIDEPISIDLGDDLGVWEPKNFGDKFQGPITVRTALETSNNMVTIKLAQKAGMKHVVKLIERMGIVDNAPLQLSLVLGAAETTVYKMATAYAMLANGGKRIKPTIVDWVQNKNGKIIYKHDNRDPKVLKVSEWDGETFPQVIDNRKQVINPIHAYLMTSILRGAIENSAAKTAYIPGQILAGKSGTSNDSKDVWFLGYSANLVVGIYLGYDEPRNMGKFATGGWLAAPIFKSFMQAALKNKPAKPFHMPPQTRLYRVNKTTGHPTSPNDPDAIWEVDPNPNAPTQQTIENPKEADKPEKQFTPPPNPGIF